MAGSYICRPPVFPSNSDQAPCCRWTLIDEFGDRSVTETLDTGISPGETDRHSSNIERIDLDEYPWAGRSFGELENTPPSIESQNSSKHSSYSISDVLLLSDKLIQYRLLRKFEVILKRIYCCPGAVTLQFGH